MIVLFYNLTIFTFFLHFLFFNFDFVNSAFWTLGKGRFTNVTGSNREWCICAQRRLQEGKRYLKTDYQVHCTEESSPCKDHCRKFALSDPVEKDFKEDCDHGHLPLCRIS